MTAASTARAEAGLAGTAPAEFRRRLLEGMAAAIRETGYRDATVADVVRHARTSRRTFYEHFPSNFQVIFGSSITSTVIVVFTLNIVFNHWSWRRQGTESAVEVAVREGAVAVDVPDDGVRDAEGALNVPGPAASGEEKRF